MKANQKSVLTHLRKDPVMKNLISKYGELDCDGEVKDIFTAIVGEIISQQLSGKAADTIHNRFKKLLKQPDLYSPQEILKLENEVIRSQAGISYAKIKYIKGLSQAVIDKTINLDAIELLSNEEALVQLTQLKGIGPWTAEMLLMFTYKRPDVFSLGDAGLRKAISILYKIDRSDEVAILKLSERWKPYRTFASRYLWKSLDNR